MERIIDQVRHAVPPTLPQGVLHRAGVHRLGRGRVRDGGRGERGGGGRGAGADAGAVVGRAVGAVGGVGGLRRRRLRDLALGRRGRDEGVARLGREGAGVGSRCLGDGRGAIFVVFLSGEEVQEGGREDGIGRKRLTSLRASR